MIEVGVEAGCQCMKSVTNAGSRGGSVRDERLRPEPDSQRNGREQDPADYPAPAMRAISVCHLQESSDRGWSVSRDSFMPASRLRGLVRGLCADPAFRCRDRAISRRAEIDPGEVAREPVS